MNEEIEDVISFDNTGEIQTLVFGSLISLSHSLQPNHFIFTDGLIQTSVQLKEFMHSGTQEVFRRCLF